MNLKESRDGGKAWMKERVVLIISETHTWPSEAAWAWTSPWPQVAEQAIHTGCVSLLSCLQLCLSSYHTKKLHFSSLSSLSIYLLIIGTLNGPLAVFCWPTPTGGLSNFF